MTFFARLYNLIVATVNQPKPIRYAFSRLFVNFPSLFKLFYFKRNGYKLRLSASSVAAGMYQQGPDYLKYDEVIIRSLLRPNDFFIDVGANIGHISIAQKTHLPETRVLAVEANPVTYHVLLENIALNKLRIESINCALGDDDGKTVEIQNSYSDDCNSVVSPAMFSKQAMADGLFIVKCESTFNVPCRTLDSLAEEFIFPDRIRLLKVDTEGYELFVFKGAVNTLKAIEIIYFEYWDKLTRKYGYDKNKLFDLLSNSGFKIYRAPRNPYIAIAALNKLELVDHKTIFEHNENLIGLNQRFS
jgi:FkbM family methyltransferase